MGRLHLSKRGIIRHAPAPVARGFIGGGILATHIATSILFPLVITSFAVRRSPHGAATAPGMLFREMDMRNAHRTAEVIARGGRGANMGDTNGHFTVGKSGLGFFLGGCFLAELDRAALMPLIALGVRVGRECGGGEVGGKRCAGVGMFQGPVANGKLENRDMKLWFQENLNPLPSRETLDGQGWDRRRGVVVVARETHMLTALYLVDVRYGLRWHLGEETWVC